jgi:hypothetical protein
MSRARTATALTVVPEVLPSADPALFAGAPAWLTEDLRAAIVRIVRLHRECFGQFRSGAVRSVICGVELLALKRQAGHGRWGAVLELWLAQADISDRTAQRYMALAQVARKTIEELGLAGNGRLLLSAGPLPDDTDRLAQVLGEKLKPEDWRELLEAFRLVKDRGRGGFHPPREWLEKFARLRNLPSAEYDAWDPGTREEFRAWYKEEKRRAALSEAERDPTAREARRRAAAEKFWAPVITAVRIGMKGQDTWTALPKEERLGFAQELKQFAQMIEATL